MENKSKKVVGKVILIVAVIILIATATYYVMLKQEQAKVEQNIETIFNALKSGDTDTQNKYLAYDKMFENTEDTEESTEETIFEEDNTQFNELFRKLDYKIISTSANLKKATVVVEITNKDCGTIFKNYFAKALQLAFVSAFSDEYSEEEIDSQLQQYLIEQVESEDIQTITNTISLDMEKENGEWKITTDTNVLVNAVLPGFIDKINETQSALSEE